MDWLTFASTVIASLAWPAVVVVAAFTLREPAKSLVKLLTKLKYGDLELSFERKVEKLEQSASDALPPEVPTTSPQKPVLTPEVATLAESSPRAAIIEAWVRVSAAALSALKRKGVALPPGKQHPPLLIERSLAESGLLTEEQLGLLRQLRNMRNSAVHGSSFKLDTGAALAYVSIAGRLARHLDAV